MRDETIGIDFEAEISAKSQLSLILTYYDGPRLNKHFFNPISGSVSMATRPLLRQIESLQASLNETRSNSDRIELSLTERLQQTTLQLVAAQERERTAADQYRQVRA